MESTAAVGAFTRSNRASDKPVTMPGNEGVEDIAKLLQPRQVVEIGNLAQPGPRKHGADDRFKASINSSIGCHQVHGLHASLVGNAGKAVQGAWNLEIHELERSRTGHAEQVLRLGRTEPAETVIEHDVLVRWLPAFG